jgi:preprotein translocase subunit SecG
MLYGVFVTLYVLICFLLLVVVLLQQGKGGDIASAFGGASSQTAFGARAGATVLTRATTILGTLFMLGALGLTIFNQGGRGSVIGNVPTPQTPASTAPPLPNAPPPTTTTAPPSTPPASPATPAPSRGGGS